MKNETKLSKITFLKHLNILNNKQSLTKIKIGIM